MIKHWSVNTTELAKDQESLTIWKLEQWVNWGIGNIRAKKVDLIKYWDKLNMDEWKKKALRHVLFS